MNVSLCSPRPVLQPCSLENLNYQIDPYVGCGHLCRYCYALDDAESDWSQDIFVVQDLCGQLAAELDGITPQSIYFGYHSDAYQPCEAEQRQTRQALELLLAKGFSASILTKSDLVLRDLDILSQMKQPRVSVSVAFTDNAVRRQLEGNTMDTEARIEALRQVRQAGIRTSALLCPVIPFITDTVELIDQLADCTDTIWIYGLSFRDRNGRSWKETERVLERHFPDRKEAIEDILWTRGHPFYDELRAKLTEVGRARQLDLRIHV